MQDQDPYPRQYYEFFSCFNQGDYYACHDLLEEIWLEQKQNKFLQGLLQMAVALYHFECGNIKGARLMLTSAHRYLRAYVPEHWELELSPVLAYIEKCLRVMPQVDRWPVERLAEIPLPRIRLALKSSAYEEGGERDDR
ncbi:hypothetical protein BSNK01_26710 [Bacillaceae bacterium]